MSYHTFQIGSTSAEAKEQRRQQHRPPNNRRTSTNNACNECRRRKIRCDGTQPCQQCVWYQHPELCSYARTVRKAVPSRSTVEGLQARVELLTGICSRLFPNHEPQQLAALSGEDLARLVLQTEESSVSPESHPTPAVPITNPADNVAIAPVISGSKSPSHAAPQSSAGADSLSALEQAPERDPIADEAQRYGPQMQSLSDDVNALSISSRRKASYVGVSSINAALEVIFKVEPSARSYMAQYHNDTADPSRRGSEDNLAIDLDADPFALPPPDIGERYIETYFNRVHPMMPMIDEEEFRHLYLYTNRTDTPWLVLLNIVLALGALSDETADKEEHLVFSHRVRMQFSLELFGSGNLFVLQALGLLTGYYLHWLSRPNEANALMGAALRMAIAMGLHREFNSAPKTGTAEIPVETRRRTFWTLVLLDTYAAMTTGRPTLGRLGPGITVEGPKIPEQKNNAQYLASLKLLPIVHNVKFSRLATHIQDKLASLTILPASELKVLDAELVQWHDELPPILVHTAPPPRAYNVSPGESGHESRLGSEQPYLDCPIQLRTPRLVMFWWYMTLRILAHRPVLLASALRRLPFDSLSEEEQEAVTKCRLLAGQMIDDVDRSCTNELHASWNAVWQLYQAVMVPMVSLFLHTSLQQTSGARAGSDEEVESWRRQIHTAIAFYERTDVNISRKCRTMLLRLYDANINIEQASTSLASVPGVSGVDWNPQAGDRNSQYLPVVPDNVDGLAGDMVLDEWLQAYDEPLDAAMAWNDVLWSYGAPGGEAQDDAFLQAQHFSAFRPPMHYMGADQQFQ